MIDSNAPIPSGALVDNPPRCSRGRLPSLQASKRYWHGVRARLRSNRFRQCGFTLIELLFVVLLLGTVMTVIMACFEGGLRVYDRVSAFGSSEMDAYLAGETLSRDLKNIIQTDPFPLTGESQILELQTMATVGPVAGQLQQVRYEVDDSGFLRLTQTPEDADSSVSERVETERLMGVGTIVRLRYQDRLDGAGSELGWSDTWTSSSNLPIAVQLEIGGDAFPEGPVLRTVLLETAKTGEAQP